MWTEKETKYDHEQEKQWPMKKPEKLKEYGGWILQQSTKRLRQNTCEDMPTKKKKN